MRAPIARRHRVRALAHLSDHGDDDTNFALMSDLLFQDHDVLMLYRAGLDGIEGDELTSGSNLHPRDWFTPFQPC